MPNTAMVRTQRRPAGRLASLAAAAAAAYAALALGGTSTFALGSAAAAGRIAPSSSAVAAGRMTSAVQRRAEVEMEAPPSDTELTGEAPNDARPYARKLPKREIPGTFSYARRNLCLEAYRFKPQLEDLLAKQLSIHEITFALNRRGSELRHLLWKPRMGLPVFTRHKVKQMLKRVKDDNGIRLVKKLRPPTLPPNAPGAFYPEHVQEVFAEVPPLGWQNDKKALPESEPEEPQEEEAEAAEAEEE